MKHSKRYDKAVETLEPEALLSVPAAVDRVKELATAKFDEAIDWLCKAFGFEVRLKVDGEGGRIEHSELVLGGGLVRAWTLCSCARSRWARASCGRPRAE